jgi:predicted PurR-regulated permease PerM
MDEAYLKRILTTTILIGLLVLAYFIIKPIILSIIGGIVLAFIFFPVYDWLNKKIKHKNISASIIVTFLVIIILIPLWFLVPLIVRQSFEVFRAVQKINFIEITQNFFPALFTSDELATQLGSIINSFASDATSYLMNSLGRLILDFPAIFLQFFVVLFVFYYVLRDRDILLNYIKSLLPFPKEVEKQLFSSSRDITNSILYGQVVIGILQGIVVAVGLIIFAVPNSLFLSLLAILAGIFPIIGTTLIWLPVAIFLFSDGMTYSAIGVSLFGLISNTIDNLLRPVIVSRRTQLKPSIILVGMIGGLFVFGILGFIIGPLVLAYLLIILELYRKKSIPSGVFEILKP